MIRFGRRYHSRRKNDDRRNPAGGLGEGTRTIRKGGWLKFGDDYFFAEELKRYAGRRAWVNNLSDAFSPETASVLIDGEGGWIGVRNVYHAMLKNELPAHLNFLRVRQGMG